MAWSRFYYKQINHFRCASLIMSKRWTLTNKRKQIATLSFVVSSWTHVVRNWNANEYFGIDDSRSAECNNSNAGFACFLLSPFRWQREFFFAISLLPSSIPNSRSQLVCPLILAWRWSESTIEINEIFATRSTYIYILTELFFSFSFFFMHHVHIVLGLCIFSNRESRKLALILC